MKAAAPLDPDDGLADAELRAYYAGLHRTVNARVNAEVVLVTPEVAADWLSRNKGNRPLGSTTVGHYARLMRTKQWVVNGEPIIIDDDDNLLDGQHRLQAVLRAGVPVPMLVAYGVPAAAFPTLNTGKTRSLADVLAINGESHQRTLAGAVRWLGKHLRGRLTARGGGNTERMSHTELARVLDDHPGLRSAVEFVLPLCTRGLHQPSIVAFLYYEMSRRHPDLAEPFFTQVLTQQEIPVGSPQAALNQWINNQRDVVRTQAGAVVFMAVFVKAWNAAVRGLRVTALSWRPSNNEQFPSIA